jgi:hypothetical protein
MINPPGVKGMGELGTVGILRRLPKGLCCK